MQNRHPEDNINRTVGKRQRVRGADMECDAALNAVDDQTFSRQLDQRVGDVETLDIRSTPCQQHGVFTRPATQIEDPLSVDISQLADR